MKILNRLFNRIDILSFYTTTKCNLNCIYCLSDKHKRECLTLEDKKSVIAQARKMGARSVYLAGSGEPLMDKDLFPLLEYINSQGMQPVVITNGTLISKKTAKQLYNSNVIVCVKVPSFDKKILEELAGKKGVYKLINFEYFFNNRKIKIKIPSFLKYLIEEFKDKKRLEVGVPVSKINIVSLIDIIEFCKRNGIKIYVESLIYKGNALKNYSKLKMSPMEEKKLIELIETSLPYFKHKRECIFESNPFIDVDGSIAICFSRSADVGTIKEKPLADLFREVRKKYKDEFKRKIDKSRVEITYHGLGSCRGRSLYNEGLR